MDTQEDLIDLRPSFSPYSCQEGKRPHPQYTAGVCMCAACSKPVMDVLATLCAQHHLIPSDLVIRFISTNQNHIHFKPNSPIGSLKFEKVVLQAKLMMLTGKGFIYLW